MTHLSRCGPGTFEPAQVGWIGRRDSRKDAQLSERRDTLLPQSSRKRSPISPLAAGTTTTTVWRFAPFVSTRRLRTAVPLGPRENPAKTSLLVRRRSPGALSQIARMVGCEDTPFRSSPAL